MSRSTPTTSTIARAKAKCLVTAPGLRHMYRNSNNGWMAACNREQGRPMIVRALKAPIVQTGERLLPVLLAALPRALRERDIVCVTSKVVALEQGRCVKLSEVQVSEAAQKLPQLPYSKDFKTYPGLAQLIIDESEKLFQAKYVYVTL